MQALPHPTPTAAPAGQAHAPSQATGVQGGAASAQTLVRVGRVLQDWTAGRDVSDAELRQHAADCALLSEQAHARFTLYGNPADRDDAVLWSWRMAQAHRCLSPQWKAAREAQIQRDIAAGTGCYFIDRADAERATMRGRE